MSCNITVLNNAIVADDAEYTKKGKSIIFKFIREEISFHKIQIEDKSNNITYIFKIAIMDMPAQFILPTVKHSFSIVYKPKKSNCRIKLVGVGTDLVFNKGAEDIRKCKLGDNEIYSCKCGERLYIYSSENELVNLGSGIKIDINFSGVIVPFVLYPDEPKSQEIIGRRILKEKLAAKKSFVFENDAIQTDAQEYFAKTNLLRELRIEKEIVSQKAIYGQIRNFYTSDKVVLEKKELKVPEKLAKAYTELLSAFEEEKTIPTLAYLGGGLKSFVSAYIEAFKDCYASLQDGEILSPEQESALQIGTIEVGRNAEEILFTPFHPLNLAYQLSLLEETGIENATDVIIERLNSVNLLPYIQKNRRIYKVSDELYSQEWKYYAPVENKKYRGGRRYVPRLVEEKISEFISHFRYIFDDINNKTVRINLINMGDCSEVFLGLAQFLVHAINRNADIDKLVKFELHIYTDDVVNNVFSNIKEYATLKNYLEEQKLFVESGKSMNNLEGIISKNISCYFHKDSGKSYEYAHVTFYEMESEITSEQATMSQIETGVSLEGLLSGIPSSKYGHKYRTGYGSKYAEKTPIVELASKCNALMQVESTGNPYHEETSISTQIDETAEHKMDYIYKNSNWVVFVDPKVDLDFFSEKEANSDLLIIHYSDQYTSSSGYDAITVTHKSQQYSMVIQEYLKLKGVEANFNDVHNIINLFNAINGDWLLRLVSSKRGAKDSTFSREKISIVAAIKFMLAFLRHDDIVWVPISLEEMLRVSGGTGLSKDMEGSDETVVEGREKNQDSMDKDSSAFSVKEDENKTAVAQHTETKEEGQVAEESKSMQVLFGNNDQNGSAIIWSPNDTTQLFHTNTGIIGTMGTGKTQFTKSLITQMYREQGKNVEGKPVGILIFDYKGDYNETKTDFVEVTNATIYKPYHLPFNPLALTKSSVFKPLLPMHTANAFKDTLSKAFNLGPKQQNTLLQCILETYRASGIMPANPDTWDEPAPTLYQVYQRYMNDEEIKKGDSLSAALDTLMMFEVFEANPNNTKTLFEILNGVVVIDLSSYDENIQSLVVAITLDLFYSQMQALGSSKMEGNYRQLTKMILVDEADNFMSRDFPSLKKILKEGREFGVGTILSTQSLKHFGSGDDDYAKYILTWVVHNVSDLKNSDIDFVFKTESKSQESSALFNAIKTLEKHHSVVKIGNDKPVYMKDKAFWQLYKELY